MGVKIPLDEIKDRLYKIFGDKYEYDFSNFINTHSKIEVKCSIHGWRNQMLKNLFNGHGCSKCGDITSSDKQRSNIDDILLQFKNVHDDKYDYSKFKYTSNRNHSIIICSKHGEFKQSPYTHSKGHGCPECSNNKRFTKDKFIDRSNKIHTNKYLYDYVEYKNMHTKVKIICSIHGEFMQPPQEHINGQGCPKCNQSKGERMIEKYLTTNKIDFIPQKKFDDCRYIKHLVFDFYLPKYNTCIEFNGIQHYYPVDIFGGEYNLDITIKRDRIKEEYCKLNDIKLIVIKQDKKHIDIKDVSEQINSIISKLI
jgi:hypothetical protein